MNNECRKRQQRVIDDNVDDKQMVIDDNVDDNN